MKHLLFAISLLALLTAACAAPAPQPSGGTTSDQPVYGGTFSGWITTDPFDWDLSYIGKSYPNRNGISLAYNSLLGMQAGPEIAYAQRVLRPELAERWEVSPDARSFTFHLRKGARFADKAPVNGREVNAADVKWSYEYWSREGQFKDKKLPTAQYGWMFEGLDKIETLDASTVKVTFKEPFAPFLSYSASEFIPVAAHEIYDRDGNLKDQILGTGAYQLETAQKGSKFSFKKNPTYWNSGRPYIDQIDMLVLPEVATAYAAFQARKLDYLGGGGENVTTEGAKLLAGGAPNAVMYEYANPQQEELWISVRKPPLDDVRIRKALTLAVDRDELIKVFTDGKGTWALSGAFPDTFTQEEIKKMVRYDPAEAKRLVAEAGYANGLDIEFSYPGKAYGDEYITRMELMQQQFKKAGINLVFKNMDKETHSSNRKAGDYYLNITGVPLEGDIDSNLFQWFHSSSKGNYSGMKDPKLNTLIEAQRKEADPGKRNEIVREAVRYINTEVYDNVALYYPVEGHAWQPWLKNYGPNWGYIGWPLEQAWLDK